MYKKGELFRRMLDERTAGFMDANTNSLGCDATLDLRYHDPNENENYENLFIFAATPSLSARGVVATPPPPPNIFHCKNFGRMTILPKKQKRHE